MYFTGTLYLITRVMVVYGGLQTWVAVLVNALLIAYLALFPALFALVVRHTVTRLGSSALLASPAAWVATELGRAHLVALGLPHHRPQQRLLHQPHHKAVQVGGGVAAQAAHALGIAPGTVKSRIYYALQALRLAMEELRAIE